jgi:uncharacterized membrane protein
LEQIMTSLVALVFPHETTASAAAEDARNVSDLVFRQGTAAVISCDLGGTFHVMTSYSEASGGVSRSLLWTLLFGDLLLDSADPRTRPEPDLGSLQGLVREATCDAAFKRQVCELLQPGTSALFLMVDEPLSPRVLGDLNRFGGTALQSRLRAALP